MKRAFRHAFVVGMVSPLGLLGACDAPSSGGGLTADLVLLNGNVITVDAQDRVAHAVAVRGREIVAVGEDRDMRALIGPSTRQVDLGGRTVTPGLLDSHAHFWSSGATRLHVLDLSYPAVKSVADIVAAVKAKVQAAEPGAWIQGRGWDEGKLAELRYVYAADLDSISPDNPVWLTQTMGHYGAANSAALRLAGVTTGTPNPPAGTIDRTADGSPTGVLKESAQRLVSRLIPEFTEEQIVEGMKDLARGFNQECMTGVKDLSVPETAWDHYRRLAAAGDMNLRVFVLWGGTRSVEETQALIRRIGPFTKPYLSTGDDHIISGGVKLYADGSGGARTAWLYEDWNKDWQGVDTSNVGYPTGDPEILRKQIRLYTDAGIHVSVHAIGDRAIDWVVDSYAEALEANPIQGLRHGIIHANIPTDHAIERMADLQKRFDAAYPEPQGSFTWWIGDTYAGNFGPERSLRLNPFHTYMQKGIIWGGGSDYPVTPFPARYGVWSTVARKTLLGVRGEHPFGTDESVDVHTALRSFTMWAARQMFMEKRIGSIEVGKHADLAVWDRDPYTVETADLENMRCEMTVFDGKVVWEAGGA